MSWVIKYCGMSSLQAGYYPDELVFLHVWLPALGCTFRKSAIKITERSTSRDDDDSMRNTCLMLSTSTAFLVGASLRPVIASLKAFRCVRILKRYGRIYIIANVLFWDLLFCEQFVVVRRTVKVGRVNVS